MNERQKKIKRDPPVSRQPVALDFLLSRFLKKSDLEKISLLNRLIVKREEIFGDYVSKQVEIIDFSRGVLFLKVPSGVFRQELFLQKKAIIDKCNQVLETSSIYDVRFK